MIKLTHEEIYSSDVSPWP